ncbi:hypothetical protein [Wolbachia endosymbiont (group A) of Cydia splendana]|nr:hypothetical protein [Wolbachia endosymbiont (group A) of Cydia splendana]
MKVAFHPKGQCPDTGIQKTSSKCTIRTRSQCLGTGMTKKGAQG